MLGRLQEILALRGCLEEAVRYRFALWERASCSAERKSRQLTISFLSIATKPQTKQHCFTAGGITPRGTSWVRWLPSSEVLAARVSLSDSLVSASDL